MHLQLIDWVIVLATLLICFVPALFFGKRAGKNTSEFFASGRSVPWWLAGLSMVATTFSSDTPNWVTEQVRKFGVAGNWQWWAFVLTGVSTVFFFARLWRRSGGDDGPGVLRTALFGQGRLRRARFPRGLSGPVLQLLHHGHGDPGRVQDRQHSLRPAAVADDRPFAAS
jgi:Na+(H+)/acetate symporter ActP